MLHGFLTAVVLTNLAFAQPQNADVPLGYEEALKMALENNSQLLVAKETLTAAAGAILVAQAGQDMTFESNLGKSNSTGESTREFGEVLSEYEGLDWGTSLRKWFPTGTQTSLDWSNTRSDFKYELRDSGFVVESDEPLFQSKLTATITQSLLEGNSAPANMSGVRQAKNSKATAELQLAGERQQVLADTAKAYWTLYSQQRTVEIAQRGVEVAVEEQRIVEALVDLEKLAPLEITRVKTSLIQAKSALIEGQHAAKSSQESLALLIGMTPQAQITLTSTPTTPNIEVLDTNAAIEMALANNPEIFIARAKKEEAQAKLRDAKHARLPSLNVTGRYGVVGYEPSHSDAINEMLGGDMPEWYIGGDLSVPLGNSGDRGIYLMARSELATASHNLQSLRLRTQANVRAQLRTIDAAVLQLELVDAQLELADQTLAGERALQQAGRAIQKDVLEAIKGVDDARRTKASTQADLQTSIVELERLLGTLL